MNEARKLLSPESFALEYEGQCFELVYGTPQAMPPAKTIHSNAQTSLVLALGSLFQRKAGTGAPGGWWFATEAPVKYGHLHLFSHDIAGWRRERAPKRPTDYPVSLRPDWVCEILSSNFRNDAEVKKKILHEWQVPFLWLVDPAHQEIRILEWEDAQYRVVSDVGLEFSGSLPPFDALPLAVKDLFGVEDED